MEEPVQSEMLDTVGPGPEPRRKDATGRRIVAALIDFIPLIGLFALMAAAFGDVTSGDGEFGGGNAANTVSIRVYYHVVPAAAFN